AIESPLSQSEFQVYPTPTKGSLHLEYQLSNQAFDQAAVELVNLQGQIVATQAIKEVAGISTMDLALPSGIYLLHLRLDGELRATQKVIVQR
ncbi:MAG: T9SS type A sorting domain-containing protein, partial [Bacteroidota bacterium]